MDSRLIIEDFLKVQGLETAYSAEILSKESQFTQEVSDEVHNVLSEQFTKHIREVIKNTEHQFKPVSPLNCQELSQNIQNLNLYPRSLFQFLSYLQILKGETICQQSGLDRNIVSQIKMFRRKVNSIKFETTKTSMDGLQIEFFSALINLLEERFRDPNGPKEQF